MIRDFEITDMNSLVKLQHHIKPNRKFIVAERYNEVKGYVMCTVFSNPYNGKKEGLINFLYADP